MAGKLTDARLRALKPSDTVQKVSDGGGLYIHVSPAGGKLWRMAYRFEGKQKTLSLGAYPAIGLKEAREARDNAKALLVRGIDPSAEKRRVKAAAETVAKIQATTFEVVGREWFEKKTPNLAPGYRKQLLSRLENHLFPFIGDKPVAELEPAEILAAVRYTEERGAVEMAHKLVQLAGKICSYARLVGYATFNAAAGLGEALPPLPPAKHRAAIISPPEIGGLLRAIETYPGDLSIRYALKILPYVFVRSGELRCAEWGELDFDKAVWIIPAGRMKMKRPHIVPLARQVVKLFEELRQWTGQGRLVFPSPFSASKPITDVGLLNALRRLGYGRDEMSIHGFRGMASTLLNEQGYRSDVIEAQLAHGERNAIRAAYNHAEYMEERRAMMQAWADYLDELRAGA